MEIKTLNKEHEMIIKGFKKEIEGFVYRITEEENWQSFKHFKPVLSNAEQLHNNIGNELQNSEIEESEWVFMFPNYLLFAGIGFAAGLKNHKKEDHINKETEELFHTISKTINDLELMLNKHNFSIEKQIKKITQPQKKQK